jgi:deoxyinosine 3'endonuclease (endonuclease V)
VTVYVDDMRARFGRMVMCHMIADTSAELLAMADRIGVARRWLRQAGTAHEHFDIAISKRTAAIAAGAVQITWKQCGALVALRRHTGQLGDPATAVDRLLQLRATLRATAPTDAA